MKMCEVRKKDGTVLYGHVSDVDYGTKTFYLLRQDQVGMIGRKQGTPCKFEECDTVYFRERDGGAFEPPNQLPIWSRQTDHPAGVEG